MSTLPPELVQKLQAAGMKMSAITTDAAEAFERGEFVDLTINNWLTKQKEQRPHCFIGSGQIDLEQAAFAEGNLTARSRLIKDLGESEADARAKEWGLKGVADFKTRGQRPGGEVNKEKPSADNPWSRDGWNITKQGSVVRADPALAARLAKAAGSFVGATKPARAA